MRKTLSVFKQFSIWQILLIAILLRLILINQSFWLDEASQAMTSFRSITDIWFYNTKDFHPPLMYILTHFWIMISRSEVWLRILPVAFGVLTVYFGYLLANRLFNNRVGLLFGLLLAIAPYHIYYSQEFRMYSLVTLLVTLSMYFFVRLIKGENRLPLRIGFTISSVLILYTHYLGGTIFAVQFLYLLLFERKYLLTFFGYYLVVGVLFLPWIPQLFAQLQLGQSADSVLPGWTQMLSLSFYKAIPLLFVKFIIGRLDFTNTIVYVSVIATSFSIVGLGFLPVLKKIKERSLMLVLFWFFVPVLVTFLLSFKLPMFQPFRLLFCLPAFLLLLAVGLDSWKRLQIQLVTAVLLVFMTCQAVFWFTPTFWREDWRNAVADADQFVESGGTVVFAWSEPFPPYQFYSKAQKGLGVVEKNPATFEQVSGYFIVNPLGNSVVLFDYLSQLTDPDRIIKQQLTERNYILLGVKDYIGVGQVHYYR